MAHIKERLDRAIETARLVSERRRARATGLPVLGLFGAHDLANLGDDVLRDAVKLLFPDRALATYSWELHENRLSRLGLTGGGYFESVALGGGTLINEFARSGMQDALRRGCRAFTLGTGVGSAGYEQAAQVAFEAWAAPLRDFARVGVRGPLSRQRLAEIGVSRAEVVGDLALAFARDSFEPPAATPRVLLNSFCGAHDDPEGEYAPLCELDELVRELRRDGCEIVPVAMNPRDEKPLRRLLERAGAGELKIHRPATFDEFAHIAGDCSFAVAVRLHAAILSACLGVPPLMLGYRDKCLDFMASMELDEWNVALESAQPGDIIERARALRLAAPALRPVVLQSAQKWRDVLRAYAADYRDDPAGFGRAGHTVSRANDER